MFFVFQFVWVFHVLNSIFFAASKEVINLSEENISKNSDQISIKMKKTFACHCHGLTILGLHPKYMCDVRHPNQKVLTISEHQQ